MMNRRTFVGTLVAGLASGRAGAQALAVPSPIFGLCGALGLADKVKAAGGDFIECGVDDHLMPLKDDAAFAAHLLEIKASSLPVPACNGFIRPGHLKCTGPKANHPDVLAYVDIIFQRCQKAGVKTIIFGSGGSRRLPDGFPMDQAMAQFTELLAKMGPMAAKYGVTVAVEPLNNKECNFLNVIGEVAEVVRKSGHPNIKAVADLYHMIRGGDTPEDLRKALDIVPHVEIADPAERALPRPGLTDFRPFFTVLKKNGFAGTISMEGKWKDEDLPVAFTELRKQWAEA